MYDDEDNKSESIDFFQTTCSMSISKLQLDIANPYSDKALLNYQLLGWQDIQKFVSLFEIYNQSAPQFNHNPKPLPENNKFCPGMDINIPIEHFKVFKEKSSKNGKPFLTIVQFDLFIQRAFHGDSEISKQTFNVGNREKLFIVKRFHQFYDIAAKEYENTTQCRDKYIKLLTDNFTNWEYQDIKNNFGNKVKVDW